jgi:type II secretory pathway component PulJ
VEHLALPIRISLVLLLVAADAAMAAMVEQNSELPRTSLQLLESTSSRGSLASLWIKPYELSLSGEQMRAVSPVAGHRARRTELRHGRTLFDHFILDLDLVWVVLDVLRIPSSQFFWWWLRWPGTSLAPPPWTL